MSTQAKMAFHDFPRVFEECDSIMSLALQPKGFKKEDNALKWVEAMAAAGEDFEETDYIWLAGQDGDSDVFANITPLAYAACCGLERTTRALLDLGCDPTFSVSVDDDLEISVLDLAEGWSEAGGGSAACAEMIKAAIEAKELEKSARTAKHGKRNTM